MVQNENVCMSIYTTKKKVKYNRKSEQLFGINILYCKPTEGKMDRQI